MGRRQKREGLGFDQHDIDLIFPSGGKSTRPFACGEVKIAGTPLHAGNRTTQKSGGRPAQTDLDKRLREVVATAIDMKHRWRRDQPKYGPVSTGDPLYILVYAARAATRSDEDALLKKITAVASAGYLDAIGLFVYSAVSSERKTEYARVNIGGFTIDDALSAFVLRVEASRYNSVIEALA